MRFDDEDWRVTKNMTVPTREVDLQHVEFWKDDRVLSEFHHNNYGRPWVLGKYQFDYLLERGLAPEDKVLDFGCGAGRLAIHLVRYLHSSCYFGIDSNRKSAESFAYEMFLHGLVEKRPRFVLDSSLSCGVFGASFDWIIDFYSMKHMDEKKQYQAFESFSKVLAPKGRVLVVPQPRVDSDRLGKLGFHLSYTRIQECQALALSKKSVNHWHEYEYGE
ncbi:Methyltransferase domain-containing protein [Paucidesulfovibrio gracilis DSM 16080]|uniref:Methyltransferase domain-containing protein n=1 Tax=Paucidesulfovibrio gracilis DSM 16080 TaxID=1121449 RepID=A0A1T4W9X1_9BACT|nr:class I SAM-dependent methyltransferase [Paucidesulfovibrio gracilis]SKA73919.1 Methyltransferase domain-containing protein [Paucidesulfovibrio gracilis DSM 16080]